MHGTSAELRPSSDLSLALRPFHLPRGRERKRERERERERAFKVELAESHENTMRLRTTRARR